MYHMNKIQIIINVCPSLHLYEFDFERIDYSSFSYKKKNEIPL